MDEFLKEFRQKIVLCWTEETVSPKFLPIDTTKPASLGQCAPTSQVLMDKLRSTYPGIDVTLAIGEVWHHGEVVIPYHVWLVQIFESPKDNQIIDITGDQSGVLPEIICHPIKRLADTGTQYISYEQSHAKRFIHSDALERYKILKKRYDRE